MDIGDELHVIVASGESQILAPVLTGENDQLCSFWLLLL